LQFKAKLRYNKNAEYFRSAIVRLGMAYHPCGGLIPQTLINLMRFRPKHVMEAVPLPPAVARIENSAASQESDFAELTAKVCGTWGRQDSSRTVGELALEIVLNEIVEHACCTPERLGLRLR